MGADATDNAVDTGALGLRLDPARELERADGTRARAAELLYPGRGVLVVADGSTTVPDAAGAWADRVDVVTGRWAGDHAGDGSLLVRPDGHIAWHARGGGDLAGALGRWFGPARSAARV
jgi:hypothetical protein